MPITTCTRYVCDRCGWDSEKSPRHPRADFGDCTVNWRGHFGGYSCMGDCGGSSFGGKAWLCLKCTHEFLSFMKPPPPPQAEGDE